MNRNSDFEKRLDLLVREQEALLERENIREEESNGVVYRYRYPVVTPRHIPLDWRYDLNPATNPYCMERIGVNATMNAGAIKWQGNYLLAVRVEGVDRKSYFALAESPTGIDRFRFRERPVALPDIDPEETNVYDMRLTTHEDGWIYGIFCSERRDPEAAPGDLSAAVAKAGIVRTRDLETWERLPDLQAKSQQRNVTLHPEFVDGKYALYTRPQDGFIDAGSGGGIGWALIDDITRAVVTDETIIDPRHYHTIKEVKNGEGPSPIKTPHGWLHLAHGVRGTGMRRRASLCAVPLHDRPRRSFPRDCPAGRLFPGSEGRRTGRRCLERALLQRLDRRRGRAGVYLLCFERYPDACGYLDDRPADGLLSAYAGRRAALGCFRRPHQPVDRRQRVVEKIKRKRDTDRLRRGKRNGPEKGATAFRTAAG